MVTLVTSAPGENQDNWQYSFADICKTEPLSDIPESTIKELGFDKAFDAYEKHVVQRLFRLFRLATEDWPEDKKLPNKIRNGLEEYMLGSLAQMTTLMITVRFSSQSMVESIEGGDAYEMLWASFDEGTLNIFAMLTPGKTFKSILEIEKEIERQRKPALSLAVDNPSEKA